jgi:hypothetical protein
MSVGSWDPSAESAAYHQQIEPDTLDRFIAYSRDDRLQELDQLINGDESQVLAGLMQIEHSAWLEAAETRLEDDLVHLIRFFAVAENLPGWEAGSKSPVIPLARELRNRGYRLEKSLLQWLREVSDNRYLPYGPL